MRTRRMRTNQSTNQQRDPRPSSVFGPLQTDARNVLLFLYSTLYVPLLFNFIHSSSDMSSPTIRLAGLDD